MTIQTSVSAPQSAAGLGRNVITVASGKGGVGKTWFAATLCHSLARSEQSCLLFDGDLGLANVDIQLGINPVMDLGHIIAKGLDLKSAVSAFQASEAAPFDVVAGKSGSGALASLARAQVKALKNELLLISRGYDTVVLDLGAGIDLNVTTMSVATGVILVVITEEPTSLTDAYALIKTLAMRDPEADIRIVVNMAESRRDGERSYATLRRATEEFLKIAPPLAGVVRKDKKVPETIRRQVPILGRYPQSDAAVDVEAIAKHVRSGIAERISGEINT